MAEKNKKVEVLQWRSHSPDHNLIEMQWQDFKRAADKWVSTNINQVKQFYKEEWAKIPSQQCERKFYRKQFELLLLVLEGYVYWIMGFFTGLHRVLKTFFTWLCVLTNRNYFQAYVVTY